MKHLCAIIILTAFALTAKAQLYFPPKTSSTWDTISPAALGWCESKIDSLYSFLEAENTKAFILLKDGKIVLEEYFNGHSATSNWYWASAGKTLTAFMVGMAQQEQFLKITDTTSTYLGKGWTACTPAQEEKITIWHQLTMTTGLNDDVTDHHCTLDTCLQYLADAGTRWAYHNAPYTLLGDVIAKATGKTLNQYTTQQLLTTIGMNGLYINNGYNNVFYSNARSMARFGLLILNKGNWNGNQILTDTEYFDDMVNTSQNINESYGYLWWLNGKDSHMIPQTRKIYNGSMAPNAPDDMIAALGKNGQFINVVPSQNMVWIRMGNKPENSTVSLTLNNDIWGYINELNCDPLSSFPIELNNQEIQVYPNPVSNDVIIKHYHHNSAIAYKLFNNAGQLLKRGTSYGRINLSQYKAGPYYITLCDGNSTKTIKVIKE
ncbi:T9SS type A sorting domain-containing protein [Puteibacter caeruleilacunae]|nr:T9SS type A sorting domain-containing protein [Puteibacter caeruleilacunae]